QQGGQTEPLDSAARSYTAWAKAVDAGKFDSAAYARAQEGANASALPKEQPKPWWQRATDKVTEGIQRVNVGKVVGGAALVFCGLVLMALGTGLALHGIAESSTAVGAILGLHEIGLGGIIATIGAGLVILGSGVIYEGITGRIPAWLHKIRGGS
ncbi:MAG: hypothetical protein ACUVRJ_09270, partial [Candidatus Villigracilaceae bacterium]